MTDLKRRLAIADLIEKHTAANTVSRAVAREALIKEGMYTKDGKLRVEFGGKRKPGGQEGSGARLSRLATSFVLGYHGCDRKIGTRAINGDIDLLQSERDFDWLGPGAYFWESDPQRALEWANWKVSRGSYTQAFVVGAVIDLRNCLDLLSREDLELLRKAHRGFLKVQQKAGLPVPKNKSVKGQPNADRVLRFLDCAVIRHLHSIVDADDSVESFDTVRGMFTEGGQLFPGSGFRRLSHVQIAVRNKSCIRGVFLPLPYPAAAMPT